MLQTRSPAAQLRTTQFSAAAATVAHTPILDTARVWIPTDSADAGANNGFVYEGEISDAPKVAATAIARGDKCYWDNGNKVFTNASNAGANTLCGYFLDACLAADATTGLIAFNSFAA